MYKILVVEDDKKIVSFNKDRLEEISIYANIQIFLYKYNSKCCII